MTDFSSEFFIANRTELRKRLDDESPVIMAANGLVQRSADSAFPFKQDSNFWYLTGLDDIADAVLVMTEEKDYLILPERDTVMDFFDGAFDKTEIIRRSGIAEVLDNHEGWERLARLLKKHHQIHTGLYKGFDARHGLYINPSKPRLVSRLKKLGPELEMNDVRRTLARMRMTKSPAEVRAIQDAVNITVKSFKALFKKAWIKDLGSEPALDAAISYQFMKRGARPAYPSIIAGGKRACTLHYAANNQPLESEELLLIDAGAEYNHYASDITRVYAPKSMSEAQSSVYTAVKEAQAYALSLVKPGADIRKIDQKVTQYIGRYLKSEKLISKNEPAQVRRYYPHAISHHLGLDVHDAADYELPLAENMVITIEPGIYIPEQGIGVRIEDDILITKNGYKNLSELLPS